MLWAIFGTQMFGFQTPPPSAVLIHRCRSLGPAVEHSTCAVQQAATNTETVQCIVEELPAQQEVRGTVELVRDLSRLTRTVRFMLKSVDSIASGASQATTVHLFVGGVADWGLSVDQTDALPLLFPDQVWGGPASACSLRTHDTGRGGRVVERLTTAGGGEGTSPLTPLPPDPDFKNPRPKNKNHFGVSGECAKDKNHLGLSWRCHGQETQ